MHDREKQRDEIAGEKDIFYEPPEILSYRAEEILALMGPAHAFSGPTCSRFGGSVAGC